MNEWTYMLIKVRNAVKSAVEKATDPDERRKKLHELNTVSLLVLFMPVALYYAVGRFIFWISLHSYS